MANEIVMRQDVMRQVKNPHAAKWAHLKDNQYCTLQVDGSGIHRWRNTKEYLHRVDENEIQDGPAVIYPAGTQVWCLDDILLVSQEEWAQDIRVIIHHSQTQQGAEEWIKQL